MRLSHVVFGGVILVVLVFVIGGVTTNNGLVDKYQNGYVKQLGNVDAACQRRYDLVPNLVSSMKAYLKHEKGVFEEIAHARTMIGQNKLDLTNLDVESVQAFMKAQDQMSASLSRLIALRESYPDLKSNEQFKIFMSQLEGAENRIATERHRLNEAVTGYNAERQKIGTRFFVSLFGMDFPYELPVFQADEGAAKAPQVSFE